MADRPSKERKTAAEVADEARTEGHVTGEQPRVTVAEGDVPGQPDTDTAPGDAPADTWDPKERVSTVLVAGEQAAQAARDGVGAVVSHVKTGEVGGPGALDPNRDTSEDRYEEYEVQGVTVRRNMETGESKRV